jgi:LPXTG-motif cell wall-anchored protein
MNSSQSAGQNPSGAAANQNAPASSSAQGNKLPQTGSELPLLGLLGIGSLSAGVWKAYFKK